ncbi:dynactin 4 [Rhizoctonia solani AG-1 IB]|uniref:Dynactin subunit 4 n=1 Tax=Thanatephorus cucumeris (strain AG1-IB / isolate 7/3/14) TaxID=1108050 RepID=M5BU36_THACB|nr:dynactin 4 [Rhizoctonia solani AG-1 IB]
MSVRCAVCRHILIKPEQKSQSPESRDLSKEEAAHSQSPSPTRYTILFKSVYSLAAFAEAWEYDEDDEDMEQDQMVLDALEGGAGLADAVKAGTDGRSHRGKSGTIGVLEKRANMIRIGGEVSVSRDGSGDVKFTMLVTYQYRAEEPADEQPHGHTDRGASSQVKSFSFLTMVNLGPIVSKEPARGEHVGS